VAVATVEVSGITEVDVTVFVTSEVEVTVVGSVWVNVVVPAVTVFENVKVVLEIMQQATEVDVTVLVVVLVTVFVVVFVDMAGLCVEAEE